MEALMSHLPVAPPGGPAAADVEIVVPAHNEEQGLASSVASLRRYLDTTFPLTAVITIADNASTDRTPEIARRLSHLFPGVRVLRLEEKGRGRALRSAWTASRSPVVAYMDADLSTDLDALLPLVAPLLSGHSDVAIGTRLAPTSRVTRGPKREVISRCYNLLVRGALGNSFTDAQCGFKAVRRDVAQILLPMVSDEEWFFDTELLVLAERNGFRIHEIPVDWVESTTSSVHIARTAWDDVRGLARLAGRLALGGGRAEIPARWRRLSQRREVRHRVGVGVLSTISFLPLFGILSSRLGVWWADVTALLVCSAASAAARSLLARGSGRDPHRQRRLLAESLGVFTTNLVLTLAALSVMLPLAGHSLVAQLTAVLAGTLAAGAVRVVTVEAWLRGEVTS
jgi:hypothetical protein